MWTVIAVILHQLKDSKAQLNKINVNNCKCKNLTRSYQEDTGVTERLWQKEAIDVALHASLGRSFQIFGASKAKLRPKCLTDL